MWMDPTSLGETWLCRGWVSIVARYRERLLSTTRNEDVWLRKRAAVSDSKSELPEPDESRKDVTVTVTPLHGDSSLPPVPVSTGSTSPPESQATLPEENTLAGEGGKGGDLGASAGPQQEPAAQEASVAFEAEAAMATAASVESAQPPPKSMIVQEPKNPTQFINPVSIGTQPPLPDQGASSDAPVSSQTPDAVDVEGAFNKASVGDTIAVKDSIGFEPYVQAVAEFLADPRTEAPLTISVEGEWGAGKSSFMTQLSQALRERGIQSVPFNAWRHDKDESLWAAFALAFTKEASRKLWVWERPWARVGLLFMRLKNYDFAGAWPDLARLILMLAFYLPLAAFCCFYLVSVGWPSLTLIKGIADELSKDPTTFGARLGVLGGVTASIFFLFFFLTKLRDIVGNPLAIELRKYGRWPDYETRLAFIERFQVDLAYIAKVYTKGRKFCVFVDDLDRCEVRKSADMMQAINLMIPECKNLIFVIGMDRERVAAAVAVKHEKLLPYLARGPATADGTNSAVEPSANKGGTKPTVDFRGGLSYGYAFLEKFIQIPFRLPRADEHGVDSLLDELLKDRNSPVKLSWSSHLNSLWTGLSGRPQVATGGSSVPSSRKESTAQSGEQMKRLKESLKASERQITRLVAPALDYNPRRLKQFLNSFRLEGFGVRPSSNLNWNSV